MNKHWLKRHVRWNVECRNGEAFSNTTLSFSWRQWERKISSLDQYILPHGIKFSYWVTRPDSLVLNIQRTVLESLCIGCERIRNIPSHYFPSHNLSFRRINPICTQCGISLQNNQYRYPCKGMKCVAGEGWSRSLVPIVWEMKNYYKESRRRGISTNSKKKED